MKAIHCGFASVIPLQILKVFTIEDLDLRVCGIPYIDLEYLKVLICNHLSWRNAHLDIELLTSLAAHNVSSWTDGGR